MKIYATSLLILLCIVSLKLNAQEVKQIKEGDIIVFTSTVKIEPAAVQRISSTVDTTNDVTYLEKGIQFNVLTINNATVEVMAINFSDYSNIFYTKRRDALNDLYQNKYNGKVYTVSLENFKRFAEYYKPIVKPARLSLGILTLPFKARVSNENISYDTEFNFNSTVNIYFKSFYNTHLSFQFGAGLGSVNLNEANTTYLGTGTIQTQDVRTLTLLTGVMLSHKSVQIGIYAGWDHINNQENFQWDNNGKLWLGLGIGVNIFNDKSDKVAASQSAN